MIFRKVKLEFLIEDNRAANGFKQEKMDDWKV